MAKHKLLAGLLLGGAAYAAYHAMDLEQREALKDAARDRYNTLKDRAVDYAFYAADAVDDFKETIDDHLAGKDSAPAWQSAASDETSDDADDDIVLSSNEVADLPDAETADASSSEADEPAASDDSASDQPV
ncbi:hypothetical protein [Levilactobacillus tongjiangensis]|uniref:Uncharacterized protein n=1 Tax=Levilactobacillus tongjiangensis TaxID=2486023 RepID=A0ABW1SSP5_9LACO|nr:hypothetical protein [Levilactobacillus tongjiangensis]